ncbi:hypothetical protein ACOMHN_051372 [Nucella lapillus]
MAETQNDGEKYKFYKVVLTGGPCGGKTTGQARLSTFFENLGWKVFRAPESAHIYMGGGVRFTELSPNQVFQFQENVIKTMTQVENTFHHLAEQRQQNVLLICDRGIMDGASYLPKDAWDSMKEKNGWNEVELRDGRYNQIIHMVSAAHGAEAFYTLQDHQTRHEGLESARAQDDITANSWVGHPYFDVVDNSTGFEGKISRMISIVCSRIGMELGDRLSLNSNKRKYLVTYIPPDSEFPHFQEFTVVHDYLVTPSRKMQARLRRRGQHGNWTYTHTIRRPEIEHEVVELRMPVSERDYENLLAQKDEKHHRVYKNLLAQKDEKHHRVYKVRRCFLWHNHYFQLDTYQSPCPDRCQGLMLLETFTTKDPDKVMLPTFVTVAREVTGDPSYSMFNLSLKEEFTTASDSATMLEEKGHHV